VWIPLKVLQSVSLVGPEQLVFVSLLTFEKFLLWKKEGEFPVVPSVAFVVHLSFGNLWNVRINLLLLCALGINFSQVFVFR
jgi:hypothetical protein